MALVSLLVGYFSKKFILSLYKDIYFTFVGVVSKIFFTFAEKKHTKHNGIIKNLRQKKPKIAKRKRPPINIIDGLIFLII